MSFVLDKAELIAGWNFAEPGTEADPVLGIVVCNGEVTGEEIGSDEVLTCRFASDVFPVSSVGTDMRVSTGVVASVAGADMDVCTLMGADAGPGATPEAGVALVFPGVRGPRGAGLVYTVETRLLESK